MTRYKLTAPVDGKPVAAVVKISANGLTMTIPFADDNLDYQQYCDWLEGYVRTPEGRIKVSEPNTPEPADEPTAE